MGHSRLCNYQPARWLCEGEWGINSFIHNNDVMADSARAISRFIVGGQGLRGGDVCEWVDATVNNCCVWCLHRGLKKVESLHHVTFECQEYNQVRRKAQVANIVSGAGVEVFLIHRSRWGWREMKGIRNLLMDIITIRDRALGGRRCKAATLQEMAESSWW